LAKGRRQGSRRQAARQRGQAAAAPAVDPVEGETQAGGLSLHDLFQRQIMTMLDRADLSEEHKQSILVAMNCPCCGAGALSYTVKLKRRKP
jgi:hypothetical protein